MAQMWTSEPRNGNHLPGKIIMVRMANQIHGAIFHIGRCCLLFTLRGFHWKWMSSSEIRHEIVHWIVREGRWRNIGLDLATCKDSGGAIWFSRSEGLSADDGRYPGRNVGSASLSLSVSDSLKASPVRLRKDHIPLLDRNKWTWTINEINSSPVYGFCSSRHSNCTPSSSSFCIAIALGSASMLVRVPISSRWIHRLASMTLNAARCDWFVQLLDNIRQN